MLVEGSKNKINGFRNLIYSIQIDEKKRQPCSKTSNEEKRI